MKTISLLILLLLAGLSMTAQFQICNSSTTATLWDVHFVDSNIGVAVGDSGIIVRSVDGGLNWNVVMSADTIDFVKVKFFDTQNGIAIGTDIFITNDAGQSWTNASYPANYDFIDVAILNATTCVVSGLPTALIKSDDFGATWTVLIAEQTDFSDYGLLSFIDENTGYACTYYGGYSTRTMKTTDGGNTWALQEAPASQLTPTVMETMAFISEDTGFKGGWYNPHLQKTVNSGADWAFVDDGMSFFDLQLIDFHISPDANAYYACGWYGKIFKSVDGGDTWWELVSGLSTTTSLNGIFFLDDNVGWAVGVNGTIVKTTSGGTVGISQPFSDLDINVYPNPSSGLIQIDYTGNLDIKDMQLFNVNGQLLDVYKNDASINIQHLPVGEYLLQIEFSNGMYLEKVVKK